MFGTFQQEEERPIYGITKPLNSWNPIWANVEHYASILNDMGKTKGLRDKIRLLFNKPGWRPDYLGGYITPYEVDKSQYKKFDTQTPFSLNSYALIQYIILLAGTAFFLFKLNDFNIADKTVIAASIVWSVLNLGWIFEKKDWVIISEYLRLLSIPVILFFLTSSMIISGGMAVIAIVSAIWLTSFKKVFTPRVISA